MREGSKATLVLQPLFLDDMREGEVDVQISALAMPSQIAEGDVT